MADVTGQRDEWSDSWYIETAVYPNWDLTEKQKRSYFRQVVMIVMRRNWNYNYVVPEQVKYDAMWVVGIIGFIGFISVMLFDIPERRYDAKEARRARWAGIGIGLAFFVIVWGLIYLSGKYLPALDSRYAIAFWVVVNIAWLAFCLVKRHQC